MEKEAQWVIVKIYVNESWRLFGKKDLTPIEGFSAVLKWHLTTLVQSGMFLQDAIIQKALTSDNPWIHHPANIVNFFGEMALFETLIELGTIGLDALLTLFPLSPKP